MWKSVYVGVYQLLNWKMQGETLKNIEILKRIIFVNVSKSSDPERLKNICVANVSDQDFISPVTAK